MTYFKKIAAFLWMLICAAGAYTASENVVHYGELENVIMTVLFCFSTFGWYLLAKSAFKYFIGGDK